MELDVLVKDLGSRLGVTIETSPEGAFDLEVDGMPMAVQPVDDGRAVSLLAVIGQPPPERLEALYAMLLKANHLFAGTAGATLSLDPETNDVSLYRVLDLRVLDATRSTRNWSVSSIGSTPGARSSRNSVPPSRRPTPPRRSRRALARTAS